VLLRAVARKKKTPTNRAGVSQAEWLHGWEVEAAQLKG
jgi:hypothetical protein